MVCWNRVRKYHHKGYRSTCCLTSSPLRGHTCSRDCTCSVPCGQVRVDCTLPRHLRISGVALDWCRVVSSRVGSLYPCLREEFWLFSFPHWVTWNYLWVSSSLPFAHFPQSQTCQPSGSSMEFFSWLLWRSGSALHLRTQMRSRCQCLPELLLELASEALWRLIRSLVRIRQARLPFSPVRGLWTWAFSKNGPTSPYQLRFRCCLPA